MTTKIIYGTDTQSIEDYGQCVVLLVPDDVEDVEEYLYDHEWSDIPQQQIVTWEDVSEALLLILDAQGVDPMRTINALFDALDNND